MGDCEGGEGEEEEEEKLVEHGCDGGEGGVEVKTNQVLGEKWRKRRKLGLKRNYNKKSPGYQTRR